MAQQHRARSLTTLMCRSMSGTCSPLATALTSHNTYANDPVLPLMVWYGINPAIPENRTEAVKLIAKCKIPKVRQFIARRLANKEDNTKDKEIDLETIDIVLNTQTILEEIKSNDD